MMCNNTCLTLAVNYRVLKFNDSLFHWCDRCLGSILQGHREDRHHSLRGVPIAYQWLTSTTTSWKLGNWGN